MIFRVGSRSIFLFIGGLVATIVISVNPNLRILPNLGGATEAAAPIGDLWFLVPLILFVISMIMFGLLLIILVKSSKQYKLAKYAIDDTNSVMRENILGVRVVKSFNLQDDQVRRFQIANEKLRKTSEKSFIISM